VENPTLELCHADLEPHADAVADLAAVADALTVEDEAELSYRDGVRRYRRIKPIPAPASHGEQVDSAATYVVTGGLGTLGVLTAEALVERGAKDVVLVGRHGATPEVARRVDELGDRAAVTVHTADVARRAEVDALLAAITARGGRVDGVVHCAGVIDDVTVSRMTEEHLRTVFAGKARGARNLHDALAGTPLRFFTCFSSAAAFLGNAGQANYAAANAYLDGLVAHRVARGQAGLSLAWGAWADVGHLAEHAEVMAALRARGMKPLPHFAATRLLAELVTSATGVLGIVDHDWPVWCANLGRRAAAGYAEVLTTPEPVTVAPPATQDGPPDLSTMDDDGVRRVVTEEILAAIAEALGGVADERAALSTSPAELGLDSFSAIQFRTRLTRRLGVAVPLARLVSLASLADVVDLVVEQAR
jgi:acyl carrier protein